MIWDYEVMEKLSRALDDSDFDAEEGSYDGGVTEGYRDKTGRVSQQCTRFGSPPTTTWKQSNVHSRLTLAFHDGLHVYDLSLH
jgi:hypothetical protein